MREPSPRSSRLVLAGAFVAAIAVGGAGFLLGRAAVEPQPVLVAPPVATPTPAAPPPKLEGPLGRSELLALAAAAADATAAGQSPPSSLAQADGRRFLLRLPFGCAGPAEEGSEAPMRWRYDAKAKALRLHVAPVAWEPGDWWQEDAPAGGDRVEGFWIPRPWTVSETCPAPAASPETPDDAPAEPERSLALGQLFSSEGPRGGRRDGAPYEAVVRAAEEDLDTSQGFRLRISGRIAHPGTAPPILCRQSADRDRRPVCLIGIVLDEVAIENPVGNQVLATWSPRARTVSGD